MTQISTGGPHIAIEEHERRMRALRRQIDTMIRERDSRYKKIQELFSRIEKLEGEVAELGARRNIRKEFVSDGTPFHPMGTDKQYVCHNGTTIEWSDEKQAFFKPWIDLGVFDKVPVEPGDGYEFVPHDSRWEEGYEYWAMWNSNWVTSHNRGTVISSPNRDLGPYRRKIKPKLPPLETYVCDGVDTHGPLPRCPKCKSDPVWTTHNGWHRIGCSVCPDFSTSPTKSIKQVAEWWQKMCEPVAGESMATSPESSQGCDQASPATPTAAASASSTVDTVPPEVGKRYVCRNGEITEPMERPREGTYPFTTKVGPKSVQRTWMENGGHDAYRKDPRPYDLVAEYVEPPAKQVTLREYSLAGRKYWTTFADVARVELTGRTQIVEVPE